MPVRTPVRVVFARPRDFVTLTKLRQAREYFAMADGYWTVATKLEDVAAALVEEAQALSLGAMAGVPGDTPEALTRH